MFKKFLLVSVLFLTLVCSSMASDGESTHPKNVSEAADVSRATNVTDVTNATEATNVTDKTNVTEATNVTDKTNVTDAINVTDKTNVTDAINVTDKTNVTDAIDVSEALILTKTTTNDSVILSNNSSKVMESVPALATSGEETVKTGIATNYWLELIPFPTSNPRSLWLFVDDGWRKIG